MLTRKGPGHGSGAQVEAEDQRRPRDLFAAGPELVQVTVQPDRDAVGAIVPLVGGHLRPGAGEPRDVGQDVAVDGGAGEEPAALEDTVALTQLDEAAAELEQVLVRTLPVHPRDLVVLRVPVVVAVLGPTELVARDDHRYALRHQQRREQVASLTRTQLDDLRGVGGALDAAVPRTVVVGAVAVVLAVGHVELVLVGDHVGESETVVRGDEVDAGVGSTALCLVQVRGPGQARGQLPEPPRGAAPDVAHAVAVATVPFRPQRREVADLVAAFADVPGLCDELHLADDRVLLDEIEERAEAVDVVQLPGECRREVETESVDVHLLDPVPQAVHDQLQYVRVAHVQAVAGAGVVHVDRWVLGVESVVRPVVETLETDHRTAAAALGGVVVDHVEDDLDPRLVQGLHHDLELLDLLTALSADGVFVVRGEEPDRVVAPVVAQAHLDQAPVVDELVCGHQFDRRHTQLVQVVDHGWGTEAQVGAPMLFGNARVQLRQPLDVGLVQHGLVPWGARSPILAPVEPRVDDDRSGHVGR